MARLWAWSIKMESKWNQTNKWWWTHLWWWGKQWFSPLIITWKQKKKTSKAGSKIKFTPKYLTKANPGYLQDGFILIKFSMTNKSVKPNYGRRLSGQGCGQYKKQFCHMLQKEGLCIALAIMASNHWMCKSMDIKTAFLQSKESDQLVYLDPPKEASSLMCLQDIFGSFQNVYMA